MSRVRRDVMVQPLFPDMLTSVSLSGTQAQGILFLCLEGCGRSDRKTVVRSLGSNPGFVTNGILWQLPVLGPTFLTCKMEALKQMTFTGSAKWKVSCLVDYFLRWSLQFPTLFCIICLIITIYICIYHHNQGTEHFCHPKKFPHALLSVPTLQP